MNNVFRTELDLHRKFDLKGSTYGRTAGPKPGATGEFVSGAERADMGLHHFAQAGCATGWFSV